jgi:hypothetical protein
MTIEEFKTLIRTEKWLKRGTQSSREYYAVPGTCYGAGMGTEVEVSNFRTMIRNFPWLEDCAGEGVHELGIPVNSTSLPHDPHEQMRFLYSVQVIRTRGILDPVDLEKAETEILVKGWRELASRYLESLPEKVPEAGVYRFTLHHLPGMKELWWDTRAAEWVRENLIVILGNYGEFSSCVSGEVFPGPEAHFESLTLDSPVEELFTELVEDTGLALVEILLHSPEITLNWSWKRHFPREEAVIGTATSEYDRLAVTYKCQHCEKVLGKAELGREWVSPDEMSDRIVVYSLQTRKEIAIPCQKITGLK